METLQGELEWRAKEAKADLNDRFLPLFLMKKEKQVIEYYQYVWKLEATWA